MPKKAKIRADEGVLAQGLANSAGHARALIMAGQIIAELAPGQERKINKASELLPAQASFRLKKQKARGGYVSRGGLKLEAALDTFSVSAKDKICVDVGLSTGGFTDCLLKRGALRVHGVDVGRGDVAWKLRNDPRLVLHERTNARTLEAGALGELAQLAVIDVSFISLRLILGPTLAQLEAPQDVIALVKPQFEAGRSEASKGRGIITDPAIWRRVLNEVVSAAAEQGAGLAGLVPSPITGSAGNVEFVAWLRRGCPSIPDSDRAIEVAVSHAMAGIEGEG